MKRVRFAFIGFRHGHILSLYDQVKTRPDTEIVAASEDDEPTRRDLASAGTVTITHTNGRELLDSVSCDVVAVGDYYARRGPILREALARGCHVIGDKPLCTALADLEEIERLARQHQRVVGCQLDLRDSGLGQELRRRVRAGEIGAVQAVAFGGQHRLFWGTRAPWYFEPGKQGGTLNDIAIHAFDALPWMTGLEFTQVNFARAWNARLKEVPHFQDGAQMALTMSNGCGVLGDVSYLAPDGAGYSLPQCWRFTFWGAEGLLEGSLGGQQLMICRRADKTPEQLPVPEGTPGGVLDSFLREIRGEREGLSPTSEEVLRASRVALRVQAAADHGDANVPLT